MGSNSWARCRNLGQNIRDSVAKRVRIRLPDVEISLKYRRFLSESIAILEGGSGLSDIVLQRWAYGSTPEAPLHGTRGRLPYAPRNDRDSEAVAAVSENDLQPVAKGIQIRVPDVET